MQLVLQRPHPAQYEVLRGQKRFNVLCCGRRWGKTTLATDRIIRPALKGLPTAWFAPSYKLLSEVWRTVAQLLAPITARKNEQERWVELIGGGKIDFWSLDDSDAGRGRKYARIIVDEAALVANLQAAWEQSLRPMLADYRGGAWIISTPKGIANYFHALWSKGQDPQQIEWASWQMPTSSNPHISGDEIESARTDITDLAFAQEYLAQWVSWAGTVFRRIQEAAERPIVNTQADIIGVDWGRTGDYTVITALSRAGHLLEVDRFRGLEYALQRDRLRALWERRGRRAWIMAENNSIGGPVVEQLQRDGLPVCAFTTTAASKAQIIQALALAFERGTIAIPNDPVLIGELQAFEGKPTAGGMMKYGAPAGLHDDCVMSLAIGWAGLIAPRSQQAYYDPATGNIGDYPREYQISPI